MQQQQRRWRLFRYDPSGRAWGLRNIPIVLERYALALAALFLPFAYFFLFHYTISGMAQPVRLDSVDFVFLPDHVCITQARDLYPAKEQLLSAAQQLAVKVKARGADIVGRYNVAIPSSIMQLIAVISYFYAMYIVARRAGLRLLVAIAASIFVVALAAAYFWIARQAREQC